MSDDPITAALRAADPAAGLRHAPDLADALADAAGGVARATPVRAPRRLRRRTIAVVAAAVCIPASVAGATFLQAHTGEFGAPGFGENDTSEYLRSDAADFAQVVSEVAPNLPVPPGFGRDEVIAYYAAQGRAAPVRVQVTGVKNWYALMVHCAWSTAFVRRHDAGDTAGAAQAARQLSGFATGEAFASDHADGLRGLAARVAADARAGRTAVASQHLRANCTPIPGFEAVR